MRDLADAFEAVVDVLEGLQIPYAVMGGIAVRIHGIPRPTYDLDFTISLDKEQLHEFFDRLEDRGFSISDAYQSGWVDRVAGMPIVKARMYLPEGGFDLDVFLAESEYQQMLISRRQRVTTDGLNVWVISPEDLILLKLVAGRPRDIGDIGNVLFTQGQLDVEYLRDWAEKLKVSDGLESALRDSGQV